MQRTVEAEADVGAQAVHECGIERERGAAELQHGRGRGHFGLRAEDAGGRPRSLALARRVEHLDAQSAVGELERAGEADQAAANDGDIVHGA